MTILDAIIAELERQYKVIPEDGIEYLDVDNPKKAVIDGRVDLLALACAINGAIRGSDEWG